MFIKGGESLFLVKYLIDWKPKVVVYSDNKADGNALKIGPDLSNISQKLDGKILLLDSAKGLIDQLKLQIFFVRNICVYLADPLISWSYGWEGTHIDSVIRDR